MSEQQRLLLTHDDFNSFYNLLNHEEMQISPELTSVLNDTLLIFDDPRNRRDASSVKGSVQFSLFMCILNGEANK